jgi:protein-L-isoaspartate(D-aspartate) O-methyltransferase
MVEEQVFRRGVIDERVLAAMRKVPRHCFVPDAWRESAYADIPLPIGYDQTISQPYIVGYMTELLKLKANDRVLEIGTGSGYQAAVLAEIVKEVYSLEVVEALAKTAAERLAELGYANIHVKHADGYQGWLPEAPFDAIMVTAAPAALPQHLVEQLDFGGRMVIPIGSVMQELYLIRKTPQKISKEAMLPVRFVPMINPGA